MTDDTPNITEEELDKLYKERNTWALFASKIAEVALNQAKVGYRIDNDQENPEEWPVLVIDHSKIGQVGTHLPREQLPDDIDKIDLPFDGHTTDDKINRLKRWRKGYLEKPRASHLAIAAASGAFTGTLAEGATGFVGGLIIGSFVGFLIMMGDLVSRRQAVWGQKKPIGTRLKRAIFNEQGG